MKGSREIAKKYLEKRPDEAAHPSGLYPLVILNALIERFSLQAGFVAGRLED